MDHKFPNYGLLGMLYVYILPALLFGKFVPARVFLQNSALLKPALLLFSDLIFPAGAQVGVVYPCLLQAMQSTVDCSSTLLVLLCLGQYRRLAVYCLAHCIRDCTNTNKIE